MCVDIGIHTNECWSQLVPFIILCPCFALLFPTLQSCPNQKCVDHYKMLNENFKGLSKSIRGLMYQKKGIFSHIILQLSGTGRFPKRYFSTLLAEKLSKINPTKQTGVHTPKLFFPKRSENIGLFTPTNAQTAMFVFTLVPSILRSQVRIFQLRPL